jgi:hypothetical protein
MPVCIIFQMAITICIFSNSRPSEIYPKWFETLQSGNPGVGGRVTGLAETSQIFDPTTM